MAKRKAKKNLKKSSKRRVKSIPKERVIVGNPPYGCNCEVCTNSQPSHFNEIAKFYESIEHRYDELLESGPFSLDLNVLETNLTAQMAQIRKIRRSLRRARHHSVYVNLYKYSLRLYWAFLSLTERGASFVRSMYFDIKSYVCFWRK